MIQYQAKIWKESCSYSVMFPELAGCFSYGDTKKQAMENAQEALNLYLEEARDSEWIVPEAKMRKSKAYIWVQASPEVGVALWIRRARQRNDLSQRQLATKLGVTVQQLQKLETPHKSNPTVKTLAAISDALDERLEIRLVA